MKKTNEAASSLQDATNRKLALAISSRGENKSYIVYDVQRFASAIVEHHSKKKSKNPREEMLRQKRAFNDMKESIVGFIMTRKTPGRQWDAAEVRAVAAEKGWGPLMYDIAMANEGGLLPDRGSVTPSAKNVWKHYYNNRPDVRAMPLDNERYPETPEKGDDTRDLHGNKYNSDNPLDYAYIASNFPNTAALSSNHNAGLDLAKASGVDASTYEDELLELANEFFGSRYS